MAATLSVKFRRSVIAALALATFTVASPVYADGLPADLKIPPVIDKPSLPINAMPATEEVAAPAADVPAPEPSAAAAAAPASDPVVASPEVFEKAAKLKEKPLPAKKPAPSRDVVQRTVAASPLANRREPDADVVASFVPPERTVQVAISRRDLNRIHCPVDIADVFYSQEKHVAVNVVGADVFVKYQRRMVNGQVDDAEVPEVLDLHVVCGDAVYTMLLQPMDMDAVTLRLGDPLRAKVASVAKEWGALPLEEKVQRLTRMVYRDELPVSFTKNQMASDRRYPRMFRNLVLQGVNSVSAPGLGFTALEYEVIAQEPVKLDERDFLDIGLSKSIVGVTIDPLVLDREHRKARLIIIERSISDGR